MISDGMGRVRDDAVCGPLYGACFDDLTCRESLTEGIRSGFDVHARRAFRSNLCSKPRAYQELYQCMASMDWGAEVPEGYTPWTRRACVTPDRLEVSDCTALLGRVKPSCPGTSFLTPATAETYQCSADCARSLVTAMSQCQTTLVTQAEASWTSECSHSPCSKYGVPLKLSGLITSGCVFNQAPTVRPSPSSSAEAPARRSGRVPASGSSPNRFDMMPFLDLSLPFLDLSLPFLGFSLFSPNRCSRA